MHTVVYYGQRAPFLVLSACARDVDFYFCSFLDKRMIDSCPSKSYLLQNDGLQEVFKWLYISSRWMDGNSCFSKAPFPPTCPALYKTVCTVLHFHRQKLGKGARISYFMGALLLGSQPYRSDPKGWSLTRCNPLIGQNNCHFLHSSSMMNYTMYFCC